MFCVHAVLYNTSDHAVFLIVLNAVVGHEWVESIYAGNTVYSDDNDDNDDL